MSFIESAATQTIGVIDYGMGNLHSMQKALQHVAPQAKVIVTGDLAELKRANRLVFPGVGAMRDCMAEIRRACLHTFVPQAVASGTPVLAVCVGMQALFEHSEENGGVDGIGLIQGRVQRFTAALDNNGDKLKIPHMGWNNTQLNDHPLWEGIDSKGHFYYVHSYFCAPAEQSLVTATAQYPAPFTAGIAHGSLFATQFHPEKSADNGLQLLANFVRWQP